MAGRSIGATLTLNNGNFFTNMKSAVNASNNLRNTLNGTTTGMKQFGNQSNATGSVITSLASKAAVAVGAFAGIRQAVNFGKDVVNTGLEFEQGMANVSAISGATGAELTALSEKAKEMGATTKFSAIEASEAMTYMGMAGWSSSQMIDGIAGIMNLAAASGEELGSVSDIVTDSLTAFGLQAKDSADFADVLAVASSKSNTNVSMLGESFKNVAPVAGAMGYSMRDTTVALGLMANAGIKGSDAGTSLRSVMTRLAKPTKEVSTAFGALNLSVVNADGSMKPLSQLIPELQSKFSGLTEAEKGQYATMIAGKNAMSGFLSIVNSSPADFQALSDAIYNSEGAAQSMADTMNDTVSGKLTLLKSQFEGVKIAIFDALGSSQFKGVLQSMSDGLAAMTPVISAVTVAIGNGLFNAINGIYNIASTVFNAVKSAIENNQPAIDRLRSAFENVKSSIVNAFSGNGTSLIQTLADVIIPSLCNALSLAMNIASGVISVVSTLSPVIAGIAAAVTAYKIAVTAANVVESIRNGLIAFSAVMTGTQAAAFAPLTTATIAQIAATQALNVVTGAFGAIMTFVTSPIGLVVIAIGAVIAIGVALYKHWDTVKAWAQNLWNSIKNIFGGIKDAIVGAWNTVKEKAASIWNGIKGTVTGIWDGIKSKASEAWNGVKNTVGSALEGAKQLASEKLNNIKTAYEEHGGGIKGIAAGAMTAVKEYYKTGYDAINTLTGGKLGQIVDAAKAKLAPMVDAVKSKLSGIKDAFGNAFSNAVNFVKNSYNEGALKPVVDKVVSAFGNIKTAIADKFNGIKEAIGEKLSAVGEAANGIKNAIADKFTSVKEAVANKFIGIKEAVANKLTAIGEAAAGIKDSIAEKFTTVKDAVVEKFSSIRERVATALAPVGEAVSTVIGGVRNIISTIIDGIRSYITGTIENIRNTMTGIIDGVKQNFAAFFASIQAAFDGVRNGITTVFEGIKNIISGAFQFIVGIFTVNVESIKAGIQSIKDGFTTAFEGAKAVVLNVWNAITSAASLAFENVRTVVTNVIGGVKSQIDTVRNTVSSVFNSVLSTISSTFDSVKSKVVSVFENVKTTISNAIEKIKGFFKFNWELPKIKLPHFSITGKFSLNPPSIPTFSVQWYRQGGIMTRPTIFGMNGTSAMIGGEAGAEAILPLSQFWDRLGSYFKPQPTPVATGNTYNITVNVDGRGDNDDAIAEKVARKIVDMVKNM